MKGMNIESKIKKFNHFFYYLFVKKVELKPYFSKRVAFYWLLAISFWILRGTIQEDYLSAATKSPHLLLLLTFTKFDPIQELDKIFPFADIIIFLANALIILCIIYLEKLSKMVNSYASFTVGFSINLIKLYTLIDVIAIRICMELFRAQETSPITNAKYAIKSFNFIVVGALSLLIIAYESELKTNSFTSASNKIFSFLIVIFKIIISIGIAIQNIVILCISLCILGILLILLSKLPFHHLYVNQGYLILVGMLAISYIFQIAAYFEQKSMVKLPTFYFFYLLSITLLIIVPKIAINYIKKYKEIILLGANAKNQHLLLKKFLMLSKYSHKNVNNQNQVDLDFFFFQFEITKSSKITGLEKLIDAYQINVKRPLTVNEIILMNYIRIKRSSSFIKGYSELCSILKGNRNHVSACSMFYIKQILKSKTKNMTESLNNSQNQKTFNLENQMLYDTKCDSIIDQIRLYLNKLEQILSSLSEKKNSYEVFWIGSALSNLNTSIIKMNQDISRKFPYNIEHSLLFGFYLEFLRGSYYTARKMFKAYNVTSNIQEYSRSQMAINNYKKSDKMNGYIIATNGKTSGDLVLNSISPEVLNMFGYEIPQQLKSKSIEMLMIQFMQDWHKKFVCNLLESGKSKLIGNPTLLFGKHIIGVCLELNLMLSVLTRNLQEIQFFASIGPPDATKAFIITSCSGEIDSVSAKFIRFFEWNKVPIPNKQKIFNFCPEMELIYRILNYKFLENKFGRLKLKSLYSEYKQRLNSNDEWKNIEISKLLLENLILPISDHDEEIIQAIYTEFMNASQMYNVLEFKTGSENDSLNTSPIENNVKTFFIQVLEKNIFDSDIMRIVYFEPAALNAQNYKNLAVKISSLQNNYNINMGNNMKRLLLTDATKIIKNSDGYEYNLDKGESIDKIMQDSFMKPSFLEEEKNDNADMGAPKQTNKTNSDNFYKDQFLSHRTLTDVHSDSNKLKKSNDVPAQRLKTKDTLKINSNQFDSNMNTIIMTESLHKENNQENEAYNRILFNSRASIGSSNVSSRGNAQKFYDFLELSYNEPIPSSFSIANKLLHLALFCIIFFISIFLQTYIKQKIIYTADLYNLLHALLTKEEQSNLISRSNYGILLHDQNFIDENYLLDYNVTNFRNFAAQQMKNASQLFYESDLLFYDALELFPVNFRETVMKEAFDYLIMNDYGEIETQNHTLPDQLRMVVYDSRSISESNQSILENNPDSFFLRKNLLNSVLNSIEYHYTEAINQINSIVKSSGNNLMILLLFFIATPLIMYTALIVFAMLMKNKMTKLLNILYFMTEHELVLIRKKLDSLKLFTKELKEKKKLISSEEILEFSETISDMIKTKMTKVKTSKRKVQSLKLQREAGNLFFRIPKIVCYIVFTTLLIFIMGGAIYGIEDFVFIKLDKVLLFDESFSNVLFSENELYTFILDYISNNKASYIKNQSAKIIIEELLEDTYAQDFIKNYLVHTSDNKNTEEVIEMLREVENVNFCETILVDLQYCNLYGEGVYTQGLSSVLAYTQSELAALYKSFDQSNGSEEEVKSYLQNRILKELTYFYESGTEEIYHKVNGITEILLENEYKNFELAFNLMTAIVAFLIAIVISSSYIVIDSLIQLDRIEIKEPFRFLPPSIYESNKFIRTLLLANSIEAAHTKGTKFFT